ncbi:hypothetical protein [Alteromonas aestuariivivens]|uniref:hypothetical protein n=1 Tax=Alteromonas aestuariivivens TaxID=1938339 RepID=UPI0015F26BE5|nr:hypothetical protein [Alteromonas aestuariivivens]
MNRIIQAWFAAVSARVAFKESHAVWAFIAPDILKMWHNPQSDDPGWVASACERFIRGG